MQLRNAINNVFVQLNSTLELLPAEEFIKPRKLLINASIGQHVRHIIELFICLQNGYKTGIINYDERQRNQQIETDKVLACKLLKEIYNELDRADKVLILEACYDDSARTSIKLTTNYYREIAYNLEHAVHHMALIRIGISEVTGIELPQDFGIASSTIKYRIECAQ